MMRKAIFGATCVGSLGAAFLFLANCNGSSTPPDGGAGVAPAITDAGWPDGGPLSACGHPGDVGNSIGVGQFCTAQGTCPSASQVCSIINNPVEPANMQTYFCVLPCSPCAPASFCGEGASCVCSAQGCGCTPNTCAQLFPDAGNPACGLDGGETDAGIPDGGAADAGTPDAGPPFDAGTAGISCSALLGCEQQCAAAPCNAACLASATAVAQGLFGALESCINAACPATDGGACAVANSTVCSSCEVGAATGACVADLQACSSNR
jgi:hypothetical protein